MSDSPREQALIATLADMATESWRFLRVVEKLMSSLDADQHRRVISRVHYFQKRMAQALESAELKLVLLDGSQFSAGLAVTAVNAADFGPDDDLIVDQTLEPVIMGPNGVVRTGTVTLRSISA